MRIAKLWTVYFPYMLVVTTKQMRIKSFTLVFPILSPRRVTYDGALIFYFTLVKNINSSHTKRNFIKRTFYNHWWRGCIKDASVSKWEIHTPLKFKTSVALSELQFYIFFPNNANILESWFLIQEGKNNCKCNSLNFECKK